jgi:hypothetical protein
MPRPPTELGASGFSLRRNCYGEKMAIVDGSFFSDFLQHLLRIRELQENNGPTFARKRITVNVFWTVLPHRATDLCPEYFSLGRGVTPS